jgi:predicted HAD superfamily phosphohydrolase YqeG
MSNLVILWHQEQKMQVITNELVVCCDVDDTLIKVGTSNPIEVHTDFLKSLKNRGYTVIVWSANGYAHAGNVVSYLGLADYVDFCMTKPIKHIDDKTQVEDIIGRRIFLAKEEK